MSEELKKLKVKRGNIKGKLSRLVTFYESLELNNLTSEIVTQLKLRLERSNGVLDEFYNVNSEILCLDNTSDVDEAEAFETSFYNITSKISQVIADFDNLSLTAISNSQLPNSSSEAMQGVKLPTIQLPHFKGQYGQWLEFRDAFRSLIHTNSAISNIQKFYYLRSCIQGEAAQVIEAIEVTDNNYSIAWDLLEERFENKRLIIHNHVKAIFEQPNITKESHLQLRSLLDSMTKNLRSLQSLGEPTDQWDTLIIYIIANKFDSTTRREWESFEYHNKLPDMTDLNKFLKVRCEILEKLELNKNNNISNDKQNERFKFKNKQATNSFYNTNVTCYFCKNMHTIYKCEAFLKLSIQQRIEEIKKLKLCLNCFRPGHLSPDCTMSTCRTCNKKHNTLVHLTSEASAAPKTTTSVTATSISAAQVLLSTAVVEVTDIQGVRHKCRALLDSGSQSNFITSDFLKKLKVPVNPTSFTIMGVGEKIANIKQYVNINIKSCYNNYNKNVSCLVLDIITDKIPSVTFDINNLKLPNVQLADPIFYKSNSIDLLLGANIFWDISRNRQIRLGADMPIFSKTALGWVVAGNIKSYKENINHSKSFFNFDLTSSQLDNQLTKFWQMEECDKASYLSNSEQFCENHFVNTHTRLKDGRFQVSLPFKNNYVDLGNSKERALERFYKQEKRLLTSPILRNEYVQFMEEYLSLNHMSEIVDNNEEKLCYYIPHHAIVKASSITTKVRVVFDASMKCDNGLSLNDVQYCGPTIQSDLFAIILRFRIHQYVMTADISKMYRQVMINPDHRHFQRIFWRSNPEENVKTFQLNTVTYGTTSAPFLAVRCLYQLGEDSKDTFPLTSRVIKHDFYIDDLLTGTAEKDDLVQLQKELLYILNSAGFQLRKWATNEPELISEFKLNENLESNVIELGEHSTNKTLGVVWNPVRDTIQYSISDLKRAPVTKRSILSITSQIFDPLGLLGPVTIIAKCLIQGLWQAKLDWDEPIPSDLHLAWTQFKANLPLLNQIEIKRCVLTTKQQEIDIVGFSDASEKAYGACIYIRSKNELDQYECHLLCSKTRVAPLKQISLPRLELSAALLLSQLYKKVNNSLSIKINNTFLFSDSTITLSWIKASPSRWKTFVANRVSEIQDLTNINNWYHVRTNENPADYLSRGLCSSKIVNFDPWFKGPTFLLNDNLQSHLVNIDDLQNKCELEMRKVTISNVVNVVNFDLFDRYSDYLRLQRVTAFILRFIFNTRVPKQDHLTDELSQKELDNATFALVRNVQLQFFPQEYKSLSNNKPLQTTSSILKLNPFIDTNRVLRVGGRIHLSNYKYDKKHPMILPQHHALTKLIVEREHKRLLHCGPSLLLSSIRERFWPINGRNLCKGIVRKCVRCFRADPIPVKYIMGNLPSTRVNQYVPFFNTGIDFAGHFLIKDRKTRGAKLTKTYVCLMICLSTKAIHLEVVSDLSTEGFLAALRRFIARRGRPSTITTDNGLNFVGASNYLKEVSDFLKANSDKISNSLLADNIQWKFIPSRSPNFGSIWEAGVKSMKFHMKRVIGNSHLTFEDFNTVVVQIEGILNSRPMCPLTSNPDDPTPLTPSHFLIGKSLSALPEHDLSEIPDNRLNRFQFLQRLIQHFWKRWHKEYITELQTRVKWQKNHPNLLKPGALVIIKEDNTPPSQWHIGRITELHPGLDNVTRVVSVRVKNKIVKRVVSKICVLPTQDNE